MKLQQKLERVRARLQNRRHLARKSKQGNGEAHFQLRLENLEQRRLLTTLDWMFDSARDLNTADVEIVAPDSSELHTVERLGACNHFVGDGHDHSHDEFHRHDHGGNGHHPGCGCAACTGKGDGHASHQMRYDELGNAFFVEPEVKEVLNGNQPKVGDDTLFANYDLSQTFNLHSRPGASLKAYLDFDGHMTTGTPWNNGRGDIETPAWSQDSDRDSFNDNELQTIQDIWAWVAEDFAPFDVDVTTEDPGAAALSRSGNNDTEYGIRVVIGPNTWYSSAGGVAYISSFRWSTDTPVFVFNSSINGVAEAASHEIGHAVGLGHDGTGSSSYYGGHGSGTTGWAPIMGVGYSKNVSQWSQGEYSGANNQQDDLAVIETFIPYRPDDFGNDRPSATPINSAGDNTVEATYGIVERNTDADVFSFWAGAGNANFEIDALAVAPNLDILAELLDSSGSVITSSNPTNDVDAPISFNLPASAQYFLRLSGTGKGDPLGTGYTDYASLGSYRITGSVSPYTAGNVAPVAVDDTASVFRNNSVNIEILANDFDINGDTLSVTNVSNPSSGTAVLENDGTVTYDPNQNFAGNDSFSYTISDGNGETSQATVSVSVLDVRTVSFQQGVNGYTDSRDTQLAGASANTSFASATSLNVDGADGGQPVHGLLAFDNLIGSGDDQIPPQAIITTATLELDVTNPGSAMSLHRMVRTWTDTNTWNQLGGGIQTDNIDAFLDGDVTTGSVPTGTLSIDVTSSLQAWAYNPASNQGWALLPNGSDGVDYNSVEGATPPRLSVTFELGDDSQNPPNAEGDFLLARFSEQHIIAPLANDTDPDGDSLSIVSLAPPLNGTASLNPDGTVTYTAPADDGGAGEGGFGFDQFGYVVSDGTGRTDAGLVFVEILPDNLPPVARFDQIVSQEDQTVIMDVLANDTDPDQDPLTIVQFSQPQQGLVEAIQGNTMLRFTPVPDSNGQFSFSYTISDGSGGTSSTDVLVLVGAVNDNPVAVDDQAAADSEVSVTINALLNDSDVDGDSLTISSVSDPGHGTAIVVDNQIVYTSDAGFEGTEVFGYTITDGNGGSDTAEISVVVTRTNGPPVANADDAAAVSGTPVTINVLANDTDPDNDPLTVTVVTDPNNGTASIVNNQIVYTSTAGFAGVDGFAYTISDGNGGTATAEVIVNVEIPNSPPVAVLDQVGALSGVATTIDVLGNDSDPDGDSLTIVSVSAAGNGTTAIVNNQVVYTSAAGFEGNDGFSYTISDGNGGTASAEVLVGVEIPNSPPVAVDDQSGALSGVATTIDVLGNDSDPDGDSLTIVSVSAAGNGTTTIVNNQVVYTSAAGFEGNDGFSYTISDGNGGTASAEVLVGVEIPNSPPVAVDDQSGALSGVATTIDVLGNDTDPDGDSLTIVSVSAAGNGTTTIVNNQVVYTSAAGFEGNDGFSYTVSDGNGGTASAEVLVGVEIPNSPPVAVLDQVGALSGVATTIDVLGNDSDPDGDSLTIVGVSDANNGTVVILNNEIVYTSNAGFEGNDGFSYTISDGNGGTDTAEVFVGVEIPNSPPVAVDDQSGALSGVATTIDVLSNDSDVDGDSLTIVGVSDPNNGTAVILNNEIVYTSNAGFEGNDGFSYTISDGNGGTDTAEVFVGVEIPNSPPTANFDEAQAVSGVATTIDVLTNDTDPDGDALTITSVFQPTNGTVSIVNNQIVYTSNNGFGGTDGFGYTISDGNGGTSSTDVLVGVEIPNSPPTALEDQSSAVSGVATTIDVLGNDSDPDGDSLTIINVSNPNSGTAAIVNNQIVYTSNAGFGGVDAFSYTISDGNGGTDSAEVIVGVEIPNSPPTALEDQSSAVSGVATTIDVLGNDSDPDGDSLTIINVSNPNSGTAAIVNNQIVYTSNAGFGGVDGFSYTISDGNGGTDSAEVIVGVEIPNSPPTALEDQSSAVSGVATTIDVLGNDSDPDGDSLTIINVSNPNSGTAAIVNNQIVYTSNAGFGGVDGFSYTISDGNGGTDSAEVIVGVEIPNSPPVANFDEAQAVSGEATSIDVIANDSDPDGDPLTIVDVFQPVNGTVSIVNNQIVYTSDNGFNGTDGFAYTISDGNGGTAATDVIVVVESPNTAPVASQDEANTQSGVAITIDVLQNDTDADGDSLTIIAATDSQFGTTAIVNNQIVYTPEPGFIGLDEFGYTISDGNGGQDNTSVVVNVAGGNNNSDPTAVADDATVDQNTRGNRLDVLINDSTLPDVGETLSITGVGAGDAGGFIQIVEAGQALSYSPLPGFVGVETFSYTISDGNGGADTASVHVTVNSRAGDIWMHNGNLMIIGTDRMDTIVVSGLPNAVRVKMGTERFGPFDVTGSALAWGGEQDDSIRFATATAVPTELFGEGGNDFLRSGPVSSLLVGGEGSDTLVSSPEMDILLGGPGTDVLVSKEGDDYLDGGEGDDRLTAGDGNDIGIGGLGNDTIYGQNGDDTLSGGDGVDRVDGGYGNDELSGGTGNDRVIGSNGEDLLLGGEGDDSLNGGLDNDVLDGGAGNDNMNGSNGDDTLNGGEGDDRVTGGNDNDVLHGGPGSDIVSGSNGEDLLFGEEGNDTVSGGGGNDQVWGGPGNDRVSGGNEDDDLFGGEGDDVLAGGNGNDVVIGGAGNDIANGSGGDDVVVGNSGDDTLSGASGNDLLIGGLGSDRVLGNGGDDFLAGGSLAGVEEDAAALRNLLIAYAAATGLPPFNPIQLDDDGVLDTLIGSGGIDQLVMQTLDDLRAGTTDIIHDLT